MKIFNHNPKFNTRELIDKINNQNITLKYTSFIIGLFLIALAFNLFYSPHNIVTGGSSGVSIIFRELINNDPTITISVISIITLIISFLFLEWRTTKRTLIGSILFPIFVEGTAVIANYIDLGNTSVLLLMIYGGVLTGIGNGLILKTGFTNGGLIVIAQIMHKYLKISLGKANLIINSTIVILGSFIFGIPNLLYAIITNIITSYFTDRILLGISDSKTFYIVTQNEEAIKEFIINNLHHSAVIINSQGGYQNKRQKTIMSVIPTKEYFIVKEVIKELDPNAFFLITDAYEVEGGT